MSDRRDDRLTQTRATTAADMPTVAVAMDRAFAVGFADLHDRLRAPDPLDAEATHALRVSLRRVRSVLAVVRGLTLSPALERFRQSAAALADSIGAARDWDVFVDQTLVDHAATPGTDGFAAVVATADRLRATAHAAFATYRLGRDTEVFLTRFSDLVARQSWLDGGEVWAAPLGSLAPPTLDRLHQRVLKRGQGLVRRDAGERHALRLAVKRLRYALDLFAPVLDDAGKASYRRRLVALQDGLGRGNDRVTARALTEVVGRATDHPDVPAALAALLDRLATTDAREEDDLLAAWRQFRRRPPFWHGED